MATCSFYKIKTHKWKLGAIWIVVLSKVTGIQLKWCLVLKMWLSIC